MDVDTRPSAGDQCRPIGPHVDQHLLQRQRFESLWDRLVGECKYLQLLQVKFVKENVIATRKQQDGLVFIALGKRQAGYVLVTVEKIQRRNNGRYSDY